MFPSAALLPQKRLILDFNLRVTLKAVSMLKSHNNIAHLNKPTREEKLGSKVPARGPLPLSIYLKKDGDNDHCTPEQLKVAHALKNEPDLRQVRPQEVEDGRDA